MSRGLNAVVVLLLAAGAARAEEWKTPDGVIAVTVPDPTRFVQADHGPDVLVVWQSRDESLRMLVGEMPAPPNAGLKQSGLEQGLMKEVNRRLRNGKLVSSSVEVRDGHEVFTMTAQGEGNGTTVYFTQVIVARGGKAYKVAVAGFGKDTRTDPDATRFSSSFKILSPGPPANTPSPQP